MSSLVVDMFIGLSYPQKWSLAYTELHGLLVPRNRRVVLKASKSGRVKLAIGPSVVYSRIVVNSH